MKRQVEERRKILENLKKSMNEFLIFWVIHAFGQVRRGVLQLRD